MVLPKSLPQVISHAPRADILWRSQVLPAISWVSESAIIRLPQGKTIPAKTTTAAIARSLPQFPPANSNATRNTPINTTGIATRR